MNPSKKLKCAIPDIQVEIGPEKKVYEYVSVVFAYQSSYADSILATPMQEQQSRRITFPEISPDAWDKMMEFLEIGGVGMSYQDALKVISFYDKYQFEGGIKIVDKVLADEVSKTDMLSRMKNTTRIWKGGAGLSGSHPMTWLVKRLKLSQTYKLEETKRACLDSLVPVFEDVENRIIIFVSHWVYVAPFVVEDDRLWEPVREVLINVGEANKENFVAASRSAESHMMFKLLWALFEKEYAKKQGVTFP